MSLDTVLAQSACYEAWRRLFAGRTDEVSDMLGQQSSYTHPILECSNQFPSAKNGS